MADFCPLLPAPLFGLLPSSCSCQAYLHKSSVAGCFVDLLEMTSEGEINADKTRCIPSSFLKFNRQTCVYFT